MTSEEKDKRNLGAQDTASEVSATRDDLEDYRCVNYLDDLLTALKIQGKSRQIPHHVWSEQLE